MAAASRDAGSVAGHCLHDRGRPVVAAHGQRLHGPNLALHTFGAVAVRLVDDEDVGDLHDAGLDRLHVVAHAGNKNDHRYVGQRDDVHFVLAHADGLDQHHVASAGVEHRRDVRRGAGQSAQRTARGHAADVDARIGVVRLHANAVAENRASAERTGRIDGDDANRLSLLAILARQLIDQRALARARRAGQAKQRGLPLYGKSAFSSSRESDVRSSTTEMARASARGLPARTRVASSWMWPLEVNVESLVQT